MSQVGALEEALQIAVTNEGHQAEALESAAAELANVKGLVQSGAQVAVSRSSATITPRVPKSCL